MQSTGFRQAELLSQRRLVALPEALPDALAILTLRNKLPFCPLWELGELRLQRWDIGDAFEPVNAPPGYPALWGHDAAVMTKMRQKPNAYLQPLGVPREGRPLGDARLLWSRAGRVLIAKRMRQRQRLVQTFDQLADEPLLPLSQIAGDPIRKAIDDAISTALGLPDLTPLREAISREPVFTLKPLPQKQISK